MDFSSSYRFPRWPLRSKESLPYKHGRMLCWRTRLHLCISCFRKWDEILKAVNIKAVKDLKLEVTKLFCNGCYITSLWKSFQGHGSEQRALQSELLVMFSKIPPPLAVVSNILHKFAFACRNEQWLRNNHFTVAVVKITERKSTVFDK